MDTKPKQNNDKSCEIFCDKTCLRLDQVPQGSSVKIVCVDSTNTLLSCKLRALGVICGQTCKVLGKTPFGDPISLQVMRSTLSLRKSEARCIQVTNI